MVKLSISNIEIYNLNIGLKVLLVPHQMLLMEDTLLKMLKSILNTKFTLKVVTTKMLNNNILRNNCKIKIFKQTRNTQMICIY